MPVSPRRDAVAVQRLGPFEAKSVGRRHELLRREVAKPSTPSLYEVLAQISKHLAECREVTGIARDEDAFHAEFFRNLEAVHRSGAAEADEREVARIETAVHGNLAHGSGHFGDGNCQIAAFGNGD